MERLRRYWGQVTAMRIPLYASHAGFFMILAAFPTLVLLLSLFRYTGLEVSVLTDVISGLIPKAFLPGAKQLILSAYRSTTGTLVSISAITALWSAGKGFYGLRAGLNAIYGVGETRSWLQLRLISMGYTVAFLLVLISSLLLHLSGAVMLSLLPFWENLIRLRFFLLLGIQALLFAAMFTVLPNTAVRFRDTLPGAFLAALAWQIFSNLYSFYAEHFAGLSGIYGSVYGVALSMLWVYFCVSILFYAAALNRWLAKE